MVKCDGETVWLTQEQICQLFGRDQSVIARHIGNIFKEGELDREVVYAKFAYTTRHGAMIGKTQTKDVCPDNEAGDRFQQGGITHVILWYNCANFSGDECSPRKGHRPGRNIPATILRNASTTFTGNTTTISKRRTTCLRDARTRLGRLLVFMYSSLACGRATGEYMRREQAPLFMYARWSPRRIH